MLIPSALVICFLFLVWYLSKTTHEETEQVLQAARRDMARAHACLAAIPKKSPAVDRALAFLNRWVEEEK